MNDLPTPPEQPPVAASLPQQQPLVAKAPYSGMATASMVLGIVGLVSLACAWLVFGVPALILGILAIVFGSQAKKEIAAQPGLEGEGQAKAGFIMGIITTSLAGITLVILIIATAASN